VSADSRSYVKPPRRLFHYTCEHGIDRIVAERGLLRPNPKPGRQEYFDTWVYPVVWLTDLDVVTDEDVHRVGLGRESGLIRCNRVAWRFIVRCPWAVWWPTWADANNVDVGFRRDLEQDRSPQHWWVSEKPIPGVRLDEGYLAS
jgi:hypothetical protein